MCDKEKIFPDLFSMVWLFDSFKLPWLWYHTIYTVCSWQWVYPTFLSKMQRKYKSQQEVQPVNWDGMIQGWTCNWFLLYESWTAASSLLCCSCKHCYDVSINSLTLYFYLNSIFSFKTHYKCWKIILKHVKDSFLYLNFRVGLLNCFIQFHCFNLF